MEIRSTTDAARISMCFCPMLIFLTCDERNTRRIINILGFQYIFYQEKDTGGNIKIISASQVLTWDQRFLTFCAAFCRTGNISTSGNPLEAYLS